MLSDLVKANPNATAALAAGGGVGPAVVYLLALAGVHLDAYAGVAVSSAAATIVLFIGRNGIRGAIRLIWRGKGAA
jgi:hypothetical protein